MILRQRQRNSEMAGEDRSFAPLGLVHLDSRIHGLRPFDKLRAGCGLHSFAASRL
jgi:hypothetical protein